VLAYYEGYLHHFSGKSADSCPFKDDPVKKFLWDLGFEDAERGSFREWLDIAEKEREAIKEVDNGCL
jgi:ribosome modulation factor